MAAEHTTLAPTHSEVLLRVLRWQAARREESRGEVVFLFEDALVEVGANVIFNRRDVVELSAKLQAAVADLLEAELTHAAHSAGLAVRQLLLQAEGLGGTLGLDLDLLDDAAMRAAMAGAERAALARPAGAHLGGGPDPAGVARTAAGEADKNRTIARLRAEGAALRAKVADLEAELAAAGRRGGTAAATAREREAAGLREELQRERARRHALEQARPASGDGAGGKADRADGEALPLRREVQDLRRQLAARDKENALAGLAQDVRVGSSRQFLMMKEMMKEKSRECVRLRVLLQQYTGDAADALDGDA